VHTLSPEIEPKHKKLTRFLCQELLYEYVSGTLDRTRKKDVDEYLPTCRDSQRELENLKKGMGYASDVASIEVSASLRQGLMQFEPAWKKRLRALSIWSSQRGWRMLPYVFVAGSIGLGVYITKPWQQSDLQHREIIMAEQVRTEPKLDRPVSSPQVEAATKNLTGPNTPSLIVQNGVMAPPPAPPKPEKVAVAESETESEAETGNLKPVPVAVAKPPPEPVPPAKPNLGMTKDLSGEFSLSKAQEASEDDEKQEIGTGKGTLVRAMITVNTFDAAWPSIRDKVISLDGKAAGNVELGWLRRPNESYFHFSLPESNYADLESFLKTFGPVRISRERHPRVMPQGQIRIILTVKDGGKNEGEAEAP
jgi:hypothetical protein